MTDDTARRQVGEAHVQTSLRLHGKRTRQKQNLGQDGASTARTHDRSSTATQPRVRCRKGLDDRLKTHAYNSLPCWGVIRPTWVHNPRRSSTAHRCPPATQRSGTPALHIATSPFAASPQITIRHIGASAHHRSAIRHIGASAHRHSPHQRVATSSLLHSAPRRPGPIGPSVSPIRREVDQTVCQREMHRRPPRKTHKCCEGRWTINSENHV